MKKILLACLLVICFAVTAFATPQGKVGICHSTRSETNPWVYITPNMNSIINGTGHFNHHYEGDIIPPFIYKDKQGNDVLFPGLGDQSILANGCKIVPPPCEKPPCPPPCEPKCENKEEECPPPLIGEIEFEREFKCPEGIWTEWVKISEACQEPTCPTPPCIPPCTDKYNYQQIECKDDANFGTGYFGKIYQQQYCPCPDHVCGPWETVSNRCIKLFECPTDLQHVCVYTQGNNVQIEWPVMVNSFAQCPVLDGWTIACDPLPCNSCPK